MTPLAGPPNLIGARKSPLAERHFGVWQESRSFVDSSPIAGPRRRLIVCAKVSVGWLFVCTPHRGRELAHVCGFVGVCRAE